MAYEQDVWQFDGEKWVRISTGPHHPFSVSVGNANVPYNGSDVWQVSQEESAPQPASHALWSKPLLFYLLTWLSTTWIGSVCYGTGSFFSGLWFSIPLMTILTFHELGHYIQTRRYHLYSTLPLFIPVPFPPFGTFGAVIRMDSQIPTLKALYDIGISGPLAGLLPTLIFLLIGIPLSTQIPLSEANPDSLFFGEPLLFQWVSLLFFDRTPDTFLVFHPMAMAAWTGLFITSLNLFPMGQLDGGHVFYALLKKKAAYFSLTIFVLIVAIVILFDQWQWVLMLALILVFGIKHPPTCNDTVPLGRFRTLLGWATLAFVLIGFTPSPILDPPVIETPPPAPTIFAQENDTRSDVHFPDFSEYGRTDI